MKNGENMRQGKGLIWASVTHFIVDFICAWMIFSKIPGNGPWYLELLFIISWPLQVSYRWGS